MLISPKFGGPIFTMAFRPLYSIFKQAFFRTPHLHNRARLRPFSSSSSAAAHRSWDFFSDDSKFAESPVYKHALKFQRPATITYQYQPLNSISLIGKIARPLEKIKTRNGSLGFHTLLNVNSSPDSKFYIKVMLKMWHEMAELAIEHLKPNDCVYVWGHLESYIKATQNGNPMLRYEVNVKEINFVAQHGQDPASASSEILLSGEDIKEKYRMRLHLWQVFFSNPLEWRDLRKCKRIPRQPDFKHKDTGEALWLKANDPPWIKRQLQLLDSRMAIQSYDDRRTSRSNLSPMVLDFAGAT